MRRKGKYYRSFRETLPCSQGPLCVLRLTRFQEEFDWNITWQLYVFAMDYRRSPPSINTSNKCSYVFPLFLNL
jgi:hypothetical protein